MFDPGRGYNFTTNGEVTTLDIPGEWPLPADPEQFQVSVFKTSEGWGVQCRKGFVAYTSHRNYDAWAWGTYHAEIRKFYGYPTGSKTTGDSPTEAQTSLVDLGGYIQIQPGSVEGGSDYWKVVILGCGDASNGFTPYLAIMQPGSDADNKSNFFNGTDPQIIVKHSQTLNLVDVDTPSGTTTLTIQGIGYMVQTNYNCFKWTVANLTWDGSTFVVEQHHLGPLTIPNPVQYQGLDTANLAPYTPAYDTEFINWLGPWTDYTKDPTDATVLM